MDINNNNNKDHVQLNSIEIDIDPTIKSQKEFDISQKTERRSKINDLLSAEQDTENNTNLKDCFQCFIDCMKNTKMCCSETIEFCRMTFNRTCLCVLLAVVITLLILYGLIRLKIIDFEPLAMIF